MDTQWIKAPADTPVCPVKNVLLKDVVQLVLEGFEKPHEVMAELGVTAEDEGADQIQAILDIFVPVVNAWQSGTCAGGCSGCSGGCCGE